MQPGHPAVHQALRELDRGVDRDLLDARPRRRQRRCARRAPRGTRTRSSPRTGGWSSVFSSGMMPGSTGLVHPTRRELVDHPEVVVGIEEEVRDGEVGHLELLGQSPAIGVPIALRAGCSSGWAATAIENSGLPSHQLDQLAREREVTGRGGAVGGRISRQRQDVLDAVGGVVVEQRRRSRRRCGSCRSGAASPGRPAPR